MIKVGDKVKITGYTGDHGFDVGDVVTCVKLDRDGIHMFFNGAFYSWVDHSDYTHHEPTTGTLDEIGAQVGDVTSSEHLGVEFEIKLIKDDVAYGTSFDDETALSDAWYMHGTDDWRIVSRAKSKPQGPVITETVKRIVPGVYGKVSVYENDFGSGFGVNMDTAWSKADLIAARDVFNQLIDAMTDE